MGSQRGSDGRWSLWSVRTLRWLLGIAALTGLLAALVLLPSREVLLRLLHWVVRLEESRPVVLILLYLPCAVLLIPAVPVSWASGWLMGVAMGTLIAWAGSVLGAAGAFLSGRFLARGWVARQIAGHRRFSALDQAVAREGFKVVLLVRLVPGFPYVLSNYLFGLTRVRFRDYMLGSTLALLPHALLNAYLGATAASARELVSGQFTHGPVYWVAFPLGLATTILAVTWLARFARRTLRQAVLLPETAMPVAPRKKNRRQGRGA